jgi:hypothetical protein
MEENKIKKHVFYFSEDDICSDETLERLKTILDKQIILSIDLERGKINNTISYTYVENNDFNIDNICYIDRPVKNVKIVIYKPKQTFLDMGDLGTYVILYK